MFLPVMLGKRNLRSMITWENCVSLFKLEGMLHFPRSFQTPQKKAWGENVFGLFVPCTFWIFGGWKSDLLFPCFRSNQAGPLERAMKRKLDKWTLDSGARTMVECGAVPHSPLRLPLLKGKNRQHRRAGAIPDNPCGIAIKMRGRFGGEWKIQEMHKKESIPSGWFWTSD